MSDNKPMISDEAVEAAVQRSWHLEITASDVREILEAAAPYMLAGAWQDGATDGHLYGIKAKNPYRSQA